MMTNTEMLAGSAKYIAYAPWRKSSLAIMEAGEPWYKDGKTRNGTTNANCTCKH